MNPQRCIKCGVSVEPIDPGDDSRPENAMWHDAVVDIVVAGYGSKHDGETFVVAICDDCIVSNFKGV